MVIVKIKLDYLNIESVLHNDWHTLSTQKCLLLSVVINREVFNTYF